MKLSKNISALALACAVLLTTSCASTPNEASTGEIIDDSVITTKVKTAIFNEPDLKSGEISVETFKGTVQLSGFVGDPKDIAKAANVARAVHGVVSVKNDLVKK